jgi:hypothetical protein
MKATAWAHRPTIKAGEGTPQHKHNRIGNHLERARSALSNSDLALARNCVSDTLWRFVRGGVCERPLFGKGLVELDLEGSFLLQGHSVTHVYVVIHGSAGQAFPTGQSFTGRDRATSDTNTGAHIMGQTRVTV